VGRRWIAAYQKNYTTRGKEEKDVRSERGTWTRVSSLGGITVSGKKGLPSDAASGQHRSESPIMKEGKTRRGPGEDDRQGGRDRLRTTVKKFSLGKHPKRRRKTRMKRDGTLVRRAKSEEGGRIV